MKQLRGYGKYIKKSAVMGIMAAFMGILPAEAMPEIMPASSVENGMSGIGYTVLDNSGEIEPFHVDVIGVVGGGKGTSPMIMAKASGSVIDRAGGILQGMSGSPVYIDDRLIGAVATGIKEMSPYTFFIRPIEEMLPLWQMPDEKSRIRFHGIDLKKFAEEREKEAKKEKEKELSKEDKEVSKSEESKAAKSGKADKDVKKDKGNKHDEQETTEPKGKPHDGGPVEEDRGNEAKSEPVLKDAGEDKAVLFTSGFGTLGMDFLGKGLSSYGIGKLYEVPSPMDTYGTTAYDAVLEPGSAVGVAVAYGDFAVGATGTVTAVEGRKILGFGHSFLHQGNVNYFMTDASVVGTISGQSNGMKISNIGNIIGRVNQDRETGISGIIGVFPEVVPLRVTVEDHYLSRKESYGSRVAYNEELLPTLSAAITYAAMSKVSDSQGESTAKVHFSILTNVAENGKFERSNMFYNGSDVGQIAVMELAQAMDILCSNPEQVSDILDVQVDVVLDKERRTASLVTAVPDKTKVKPGDTVTFKTTIKPYRKEKEVLNIPYTVPKTQPEGTLHLDVRGGALVPVSQLSMLQQAGVVVPTEEGKVQTTGEKLRALVESGKNNEIIIAPGAVTEPLSEKAQRKAIKAATKASQQREKESKVNLLGASKGNRQLPETKFATEYIIDNVIRTTLQVESK